MVGLARLGNGHWWWLLMVLWAMFLDGMGTVRNGSGCGSGIVAGQDG